MSGKFRHGSHTVTVAHTWHARSALIMRAAGLGFRYLRAAEHCKQLTPRAGRRIEILAKDESDGQPLPHGDVTLGPGASPVWAGMLRARGEVQAGWDGLDRAVQAFDERLPAALPVVADPVAGQRHSRPWWGVRPARAAGGLRGPWWTSDLTLPGRIGPRGCGSQGPHRPQDRLNPQSPQRPLFRLALSWGANVSDGCSPPDRPATRSHAYWQVTGLDK